METVRLLWKPPAKARSTSLWSEVGDGVDYYFVYGPALDRVVAGYRKLTGEAPMMPRWAFGLWQSRQRYETQQQSLDVVDGFRSRRIPFDNIVQDWFYWPENAWGSHRFDPVRFPDPDGWVKAIHDRNARLMISVWGKFYPGTENFEAMRVEGVPLREHPALRVQGLGRPRLPLHLLRRLQPRGAEALLGAGRARPLPPRHGRVVDGRDRARPPADPRPRRAARAHAPDRPGQRLAGAERLPAPQQPGRLRRPAGGRARPARLHPHALGLRRPAALRRRHVVGRHHLHLDRPAAADRGRPRLLALRDPVLDGGHRRLLRARPLLPEGPVARGRRGVARAQRPLVRVRDLPAPHPRPRRGAEARDVGDGRGVSPRLPGHPQVRPPPLPDAALRLLARRGGHPRGGDLPPPARHGLPEGRRPRAASPTSSSSAPRSW